ncbi:MAG: hypothetical protein JWQ71_1853 [Pedosphaera sp.]|nr:hypothetical protein [Pedosphaera sp.]
MSYYNLKQSLSKIKAKPFNFALIEGKKSDMVLVTPKPAPGKLLDDTKKECGDGKRIAKGVCLKENGQIVFATRSAPMPAWKATLKKIFQEQKCAMFLPVELRQLGDHESDEVVNEDESGSVETETEDEVETTSLPPTPPPSATTTPKPPTAPQKPTTTPTSTAPKPSAPVSPMAEAAFKSRVNPLETNSIYAGIKNPALKAPLAKLLAEAKALGTQKDFTSALKKLDELEALLPKAPGHDATRPTPTGETAAMVGWLTARNDVLTSLRKLGTAIEAAKDPESGPAQLLLAAIGKNLTEKPATMQQVLALEKYLQTDDIIVEAESPNPFGVTIAIRTPLLNALAALKKQTT